MARDILDVCKGCGKPLKYIVAYLPDVGEVCFDCYMRATKKRGISVKAKVAGCDPSFPPVVEEGVSRPVKE